MRSRIKPLPGRSKNRRGHLLPVCDPNPHELSDAVVALMGITYWDFVRTRVRFPMLPTIARGVAWPVQGGMPAKKH